MRRFAAFALSALVLPAAASAAGESWAQPQIETVVAAGLLADTVEGFKPQRPLTQRALAGALETLSFASEEIVDYRYRVLVPGRAVTIRELDAALVGFLGLGDAARSVTAALRAAGLEPKPGAGTETVGACSGSASTIRRRATHSSSARTIRRRAPRPHIRSRACSPSPAGSKSRSAPRPRRSSCRS